LWKRCADALREQVSDATWRTWLTGLVPQDFDGSLLVLTAPNTLVRDRIENRFLGLIAAAVSDVAAQQVTVRLDVAPAAVAEPVMDDVPDDTENHTDPGPSQTGNPG